MENVRLAAAGPASRLVTVRRRQSDEQVLKTLAGIVDKAKSKTSNCASRVIQELSIALRDHETVNSILMDRTGLTGSSARTSRSDNRPEPKNVALPSGAPAQYLTHADRLELQQKKVEEAERAAAEKEEAKQLKAEKRKKAAEEKKRKAAEKTKAREAKAADAARRPAKRRKVARRSGSKGKEDTEPEAAMSLLALAGQDAQ